MAHRTSKRKSFGLNAVATGGRVEVTTSFACRDYQRVRYAAAFARTAKQAYAFTSPNTDPTRTINTNPAYLP